MSFVLGMKCSDGLAMFADTLESGGAVKRYRAKVYARNIGSEWGACWGVAGNAHVADKFTDKVKSGLGNDSYNRHETEVGIEACLKWIRSQYQGPQEDIEVVLGLFGRVLHEEKGKQPYLGLPEWNLYRGDSITACLAPVRDYSIAGMDTTLAAFILENMRNPFSRIDEAIRLGIFTTAVMKKYASGVGGDTHAFVYKIGGETWMPLLGREMSSVEATFPVEAVENHTQGFWLNHPKARNNEELLASEMATKEAMQTITLKRGRKTK